MIGYMTWRIIFLVWFATSVLIEVFSSVALCMWLRASGVKVSPFFYGLPGYLERLYAQWCQEHGRSATAVLVFRRASFVNFIVAAIAGILVLSGTSGKP